MNTISTTMVHAKVPVNIKNNAKEVAQELGVSLSLIVEQALRNFAATRRLVIEDPLIPTLYLEKILVDHKENKKISKNKKTQKSFSKSQQAIDYLKTL